MASSALDTDNERRALVEAILLKFWGPSELERLPDRATTASDLAAVLAEIFTDAANTLQRNKLFTQNMAKAACTAVLSALPVVMQ